jgi:hypothetical protein
LLVSFRSSDREIDIAVARITKKTSNLTNLDGKTIKIGCNRSNRNLNDWTCEAAKKDLIL